MNRTRATAFFIPFPRVLRGVFEGSDHLLIKRDPGLWNICRRDRSGRESISTSPRKCSIPVRFLEPPIARIDRHAAYTQRRAPDILETFDIVRFRYTASNLEIQYRWPLSVMEIEICIIRRACYLRDRAEWAREARAIRNADNGRTKEGLHEW